MPKRMIKVFSIFLSVFYVLYLAVIVVNLSLMSAGITNGLIETYGVWGYVVTYVLSFLLAGGWFVIPTAIQIILYEVTGRKSPEKILWIIILLEAVKIIGTLWYILYVDCANISYGGAVTAFIIARMALFAIVSLSEIVFILLLLIMNDKKSKE